MIERANQFASTRDDGAGPNPSRWTLFKREAESVCTTDYRYKAVRDYALPLVRAIVEGHWTRSSSMPSFIPPHRGDRR